MKLLASTVFLSALLLFLVEPLVARQLLPLFGGTAAVWLSALLFFQAALLGGYLFADWLARRQSRKAALVLHLLLLGAALLCLPLVPSARVQGAIAGLPATLRVLVMLAATVGLPFLALSATGPLLQAYWARALPGTPYRLYALSNLASALGLLAHPILLERLLGLRAQSLLWSASFAAFTLLCAAASLRHARDAATPVPAAPELAPEAAQPAPARDRALWVFLPFCSSALLSSVTSDLTLNVAPMPLLWVLPLALYLLTFVATFEREGFYRRGAFFPPFAVALAFLGWRAREPLRGEHAFFEIGSELCAFTVAALVCHGELARLRPAPRLLTRFYVRLSIGGALGGAFVAVLAPLAFRTDLELPISLVACALAFTFSLWRERPVLRGLPVQRVLRASLLIGVVLLGGIVGLREVQLRQKTLFYARSFYGSLRVENERTDAGLSMRTLVHGTTVHGSERLDKGHELEVTNYYSRTSGIGRVFLARGGAPQKVGVVGLGAGILAGYCRPGDTYHFYEIDPLIVRVAREYFSFLRRCAGADVALGDARLVMGNEAAQGFDLLVVDAFSGDSVPIHLLTEEAFALYQRHLKPGGILAMHVSNRFLDLEPVVSTAAKAAGLTAWNAFDQGNANEGAVASQWILVGAGKEMPLLDKTGVKRGRAPEGFRRWTDDYVNVAAVLD